MGTFMQEGVDHLDITPSGGSLINLPFANTFRTNANLVTLQFKGDHTSQRTYRPDGIDGTMVFDKLTTDMFTAMGVTEVTASLPVGYASRFYPELGNYPGCAIDAYYFAVDDDTETDTLLALRVFVGKIQQWVPSEAGNIAVMGTSMAWSGKPTLNDIAGNPLPGVSTKKVIYALDVAA